MYETWTSIEKKHHVDLGTRYINKKACKDFISHNAGAMVEELEKECMQEPFYCSILFDGSTDKSISEKEVVSIKLLENGVPKIKLLGIAEPEHCKAEGVFKGIIDACAVRGLDLSTSLVASAADGAAVNFGKINGVMTKLKQQHAPWMIKIHCIAHRLELALNDAFKGTYFEQVGPTL
ncbi:hypothetical protein HOLleu_06959 [Holothuria leucospilota]|uniref:DUF4371 domain-containing protein n=1 Tax=Holothuria leucospilota TaxID=206669 RepID=A0A9Q1HFH9_HOLLE|nr:hypothetical protein HOLleu_06959 [Holothuria leucospilota]